MKEPKVPSRLGGDRAGRHRASEGRAPPVVTRPQTWAHLVGLIGWPTKDRPSGLAPQSGQQLPARAHVPPGTPPEVQPWRPSPLGGAPPCPSMSRLRLDPVPNVPSGLGRGGLLPMSTGWSEARGGGCCFRRTISTIRGRERRSNSFIMITWLKCDLHHKVQAVLLHTQAVGAVRAPRVGPQRGRGAGWGPPGTPLAPRAGPAVPGGALAHDQHVLQVHRGASMAGRHSCSRRQS